MNIRDDARYSVSGRLLNCLLESVAMPMPAFEKEVLDDAQEISGTVYLGYEVSEEEVPGVIDAIKKLSDSVVGSDGQVLTKEQFSQIQLDRKDGNNDES